MIEGGSKLAQNIAQTYSIETTLLIVLPALLSATPSTREKKALYSLYKTGIPVIFVDACNKHELNATGLPLYVMCL